MYNESIPINNSPTFLGIRFDNFFNFNNQIEYITQSCKTRLNIIKILGHKNWLLLNIDLFCQMFDLEIYLWLQQTPISQDTVSALDELKDLHLFQNPPLSKEIDLLYNNHL